MNTYQFSRVLVRLTALVLGVMSVLRLADFFLGIILPFVFGGWHININFGGFVSGLVHAAVPAGVGLLVFVGGETIVTFFNKGNES